jgi:ABC-type multidrug transport system permease subunit
VNAFWALARLRIFDVVRSRTATAAFLGLPLVILLLLSLLFAQGHPFEERRITLVQSRGEVRDAESQLRRHAGVRLVVRADLDVARRELETRATSAVLFRDATGRLNLEVGDREELWGRGIVSVLPGTRLTQKTLARLGYVEFVFPGLLCTSVMFAGLFSMGYAMARYRRNLFLKKLATTPMSRATFVLAQIVGRGALVSIQIGLLLSVALVTLGFRPSASGLALACLTCLVGLFVFSGIGFALASVIETEAVVSDVISSLGVPLTLLSGIFFPVDALPSGLSAVCAMLPSTLMVDSVRAALLYDVGLAGVARSLVWLSAWGVAMFGVSLRLFRWHT